MSSVENEVISLTFDNAQFERGLQETLAGLDRLTEALNFSAARGAFSELEAASAGFNLSGMEASLDSIASKFSALGVIGFTVLQDITRAGISMARDLAGGVLGQIMSGGAARSLAIEQARFQFAGLGQDVEASMQSALDAVRGTAFGLDEAATVAASFGASGILAGEQMTGALRGVAGTASLINRSFTEMGSIFQDVAGSGILTGTHLFQFASRGLNMAAALAKEWGTTEQAVREAASAGTITFQEFTQAVDNAFGEHATRANETYTGSLANMRAAMNRLGEDFATPKFAALRPVFNALGPAIDRVAEALHPLVKTWTQFVNRNSGRSIDFLESLDFDHMSRVLKRIGPNLLLIFRNIRQAVMSFITPIRHAFRDIFPENAPAAWKSIALAVQRFTHSLIMGKGTAETFRSILAGLFAILSIGFEIVKGVLGVFFDLAGGLLGATSGAFSFAQGIGQVLVDLEHFLVDGGRIRTFFNNLGDNLRNLADNFGFSGIVDTLSDAFSGLVDIFKDLFNAADGGDAVFGRVKQRFGGLVSVVQTVAGAFIWGMDAIVDAVRSAYDYLAMAFDGLGAAIGNSLQTGDFDEVLDILNVGLLGGLVVMFKQFFDNGLSLDLTGGFADTLNDTFEALTDTLGALQAQLRADTLMKIAKAVGLLVLSMVGLSLIDSEALTKALTAISVGFAELIAVMALLQKLTLNPITAVQMSVLAGGMILIAGAMLLLSFAVRSFSGLSIGELAKGLVGVGVGLLLLSVVSKPLSANAPGMIAAGAGLILVGVALSVMAVAVKIFSTLSWGELVKGLVGAGVAIFGIAGAMHLMPPHLIAIGAGLILVAVALSGIALAVKLMSLMNWTEIGRGLVGLAGGLIAIAGASHLMTGSIAGAVAIGIMAVSLMALSVAVRMFSDISWGDLLHGLVAMAAAMIVIGALGFLLGLVAPQMFLAGVALIPLSIGLGLLANVIKTFGNITWGELGMGLLAMAAGLAFIALAAVLLTPLIPAIMQLGGALLLIGAAFGLFGAGVFLLAKGLQLLSQVGAEAFGLLKDVILDFITIIPDIASEMAEAFISFFQIIVDAAPELIEGLIIILGDLFEGIEELAPKIVEALGALLQAALDMFTDNAPRFILAGAELLITLLTGIRDHIPEIGTVVFDIITEFMDSCTANVGRLIQAGNDLLSAIVLGIISSPGIVINGAINVVTQFINALTANIGRLIAAGANLIISVVTGMITSLWRIISAGVEAVLKFVSGLTQAIPKLIAAGIELIVALVKGVANGVQTLIPELVAAGSRMAEAVGQGLSSAAPAIISGFLRGLADGIGVGTQSIVATTQQAINAGRQGESSGASFADGFIGGMVPITSGAQVIGERVASTIRSVVSDLSSSLDNIDDINPTISPVLDLTNVQREARTLNDILGASPLVVNESLSQARSISLDADRGDVTQESPRTGPTELKFEQHIHAPEQLSVGTIYRQTKSQIAMAKEELKI